MWRHDGTNLTGTLVNQYVYDDYNSAFEELRKEIDKDISDIEYTIGKYNAEIIDLESKLKHLNDLKIEYAKQNLEKN